MKILRKTKTWFLGVMLVTGLGISFPACCNQDDPMDDGSDAIVTLGEDTESYFTNGWEVTNFAETRKFTLKTNHLWNIKLKYNEGTNWLTVTPDKGSGGDNRGFTVKVDENKREEDRTAILTLTAGQVVKTMLIKQSAVPPTPGQIIFDAKSEALFAAGWSTSSSADSKIIKFETNKAWKVTTEYADGAGTGWCTIDPEKGDLGENCSFTIQLTANEKTTTRVVKVNLIAADLTKTLTVTQVGSDAPDPNRVLDPGGTSWMLFDATGATEVPLKDTENSLLYFYSGRDNEIFPDCISIGDSPWDGYWDKKRPDADKKGIALDRTDWWQYISVKFTMDKYTDLSRWDFFRVDISGEQLNGQTIDRVYFDVYDVKGNKLLNAEDGTWTNESWGVYQFAIPEKDVNGKPLDLSKVAEIRISPNGHVGPAGNFKYYFDNIRLERDKDLGPEAK